MFCRKCGTDVGNSRFCPNCGAEVAPPGNGGPCYIEEHRTVNKIAYGLIALFIGGLGIHRFYAGKWVSGIMYILFCWTGIPSLLAFVEGIVALCRADDGYGNIPVYDDRYFV